MFRITYSVQGVGIRLEIPERRVFVPNLVGLFTATQIRLRPGDVVCDVSMGSGFHTILCAKLGARRVYGIDINPHAIRNARKNARRNGVADRCVFLQGSPLEPLQRAGRRVDLIVSTLPVTPERSVLMQEEAMRDAPALSRYLGGGHDGVDLYVRLIRDAQAVLNPGGRIHFHVVAWSNPKRVIREARDQNLQVHHLARAFIPEWGQRCNLRSWFSRNRAKHSCEIRYDRFPRRPENRVEVIEATRDSMLPRGRRPAVATLQWDAAPEA